MRVYIFHNLRNRFFHRNNLFLNMNKLLMFFNKGNLGLVDLLSNGNFFFMNNRELMDKLVNMLSNLSGILCGANKVRRYMTNNINLGLSMMNHLLYLSNHDLQVSNSFSMDFNLFLNINSYSLRNLSGSNNKFVNSLSDHENLVMKNIDSLNVFDKDRSKGFIFNLDTMRMHTMKVWF